MLIQPPVVSLSDAQYADFCVTDATDTPVPVTWSITPPTGAGTIDAHSGRYIVPSVVSQPQEVTVTPVAGGPAAIAKVILQPVVVTLTPLSVALRAGGTQQFVAKVIGTPNDAVDWAVTPTTGTLVAGLYTAPNAITDDETIAITAISTANPTKTATATLRLLPAPLGWPWVAGLGVYLFLLVCSLMLLLVALWPLPVVDTARLEARLAKATAARIAAENALKAKEPPVRQMGEPGFKATTFADRAAADRAVEDLAASDVVATEGAKSEYAAAAQELASTQATERALAAAIARAENDEICTQRFGCFPREIALLLLTVLAGALGTFVHIGRSYVDFVGNRTLRASWRAWYLLYPFIGAAFALIFYIALRAGVLTTGTEMNPYGIAALAALVGMFTKQATDKLSEVFSTLFKTDKERELKDKLNPATETSSPPSASSRSS
jgi:hypothetical protein